MSPWRLYHAGYGSNNVATVPCWVQSHNNSVATAPCWAPVPVHLAGPATAAPTAERRSQ